MDPATTGGSQLAWGLRPLVVRPESAPPPRVVGASPSRWRERHGVGRLPTRPAAHVSPLPGDIRCQRRAAGQDQLVRALPSLCKPRVTGLKSQ